MSLGLLASGCAHVTNAGLCGEHRAADPCRFRTDPAESYRFTPKADKDTLVIVTLSGGGTRAAALGFGVLQMLDRLEPINDGEKAAPSSLLDEVDIISSVSGGSVTAGWYALAGKGGLATNGPDAHLWNFLNHDWMAGLIRQGLNPWTLARYTFTPYERNDVLADFFAGRLFDKSTYADVLARYRADPHQPYVILNATDLGHEAVFPFTQGRFDLLCSDLLTYRLADAVAASANFPLAFSPLGLENYSGCAAQASTAWRDDGPPQWLGHYDKFEGLNVESPHSYELSQVRAARQAEDYLRSPVEGNRDKYVHLLDGGVTDNLGIRSTLALEDDPARVPGLYLRLSGSKRPAGYEKVRRILYVVVNARTRDPGGIDQSKAPSGEIRTAIRMTDTLLDSSTLTDQDYLIAELEAIANNGRTQTAGPCPSAGAFISCKPAAQALYPGPEQVLRFYVVSVDFEMIPDKACRDAAWLIPTNWGLGKSLVENLDELGQVILANSKDLARFYQDTTGREPAALANPHSYESICTALKASHP